MKLDDDSFRKPGSVPFKWEIRPGVPKPESPPPSLDNYQFEFKLREHRQKHTHINHSPDTPTRLKPPPAGFSFRSPLEPRAESLRSRSNRFGLAGLARPDVVSSVGCFPSPMVKRKNVKKRMGDLGSTPEPDYYSDLEIGSSSRWSVSSRKSVSRSPLCYSYRASPRPDGDADWAGFGLF